MTELSALEDVVRVIFPATMMREGELLPAAKPSLFESVALQSCFTNNRSQQ